MRLAFSATQDILESFGDTLVFSNFTHFCDILALFPTQHLYLVLSVLIYIMEQSYWDACQESHQSTHFISLQEGNNICEVWSLEDLGTWFRCTYLCANEWMAIGLSGVNDSLEVNHRARWKDSGASSLYRTESLRTRFQSVCLTGLSVWFLCYWST